MNRLEPSPEQFAAVTAAVAQRIAEHLRTLPEQTAAYLDTEEAATWSQRLVRPMPESGTELDPILDMLFDEAIPRSYNTASPGYLAYIPGGGLLHSAIADLIASTTNRFVGVYAAAPALATIEATVVRWLCDLVGLPSDTSSGFLTTGGSLANFSAVVCARRDRLPENFLNGRMYVSDQVHHSVAKAATLAGFPARAVRSVPTDGQFRMRLDALTEQLDADRAQGLTPFLIVGSGGTTNTGAVDDLNGLADLAEEYETGFHVDAAYGGFFLLTDRGRTALSGIERADSVTLDPHKGLFLPYGTGALVVRDGQALRRAHDADAAYLPDMQQADDRVDYTLITPELSRDWRGLRVWLPFQLCGAEAFRTALDEKLDLTHLATEKLRAMEHIKIVAEPQLSVVGFRLEPPHLDLDALNDLNERLLAAINERKNVHMTATRVTLNNQPAQFVIRICVLSFRTHKDRIDQCLQDIESARRELLNQP
ncbi:MAG: aromatic-L-amino-acid decarboxylase [Myxococcota bacterium]|jgi:aromatic-L-amino-acid decarboxylase